MQYVAPLLTWRQASVGIICVAGPFFVLLLLMSSAAQQRAGRDVAAYSGDMVAYISTLGLVLGPVCAAGTILYGVHLVRRLSNEFSIENRRLYVDVLTRAVVSCCFWFAAPVLLLVVGAIFTIVRLDWGSRLANPFPTRIFMLAWLAWAMPAVVVLYSFSVGHVWPVGSGQRGIVHRLMGWLAGVSPEEKTQ